MIVHSNDLIVWLNQDLKVQRQLDIGCAIGVLLVVIVIVLAVLYCRLKRNQSDNLEKVRRDQITRILPEDEKVSVVPSVHADRLGRNEHPEVRDQFGMKEVFDVTAGEGKDLVRIARPLVTDGEERRLSEELMDIQPIIRGQHTTRNRTTEGDTLIEELRRVQEAKRKQTKVEDRREEGDVEAATGHLTPETVGVSDW